MDVACSCAKPRQDASIVSRHKWSLRCAHVHVQLLENGDRWETEIAANLKNESLYR